MEKQSITTAQQFDEKRFTKINIIKTTRSVAFMLNFLPGQHMKPHNHPDRELYLHVVEGNGTFSINGEDLEVKTGDVVLCGADEQIGFINTSEDRVSIYATMTKLNNAIK
ncbi:cupin domain-containing protein [Oceanobacillus sp. Castelsardo]|uniref:cupin domain-containing protein n=1 Tax=Oceanobacillus sp. Castelsardo TaxID=1851204 RepID=UPI0008392461|nr:cupin domain-containing protein [Oceanobacillus sp. Castelsardo]